MERGASMSCRWCRVGCPQPTKRRLEQIPRSPGDRRRYTASLSVGSADNLWMHGMERGASLSRCRWLAWRSDGTSAWRCRVGCPYVYRVAQIANLPFRRLPIGRASANVRRDGTVHTLQDGIPRHSAALRRRNLVEARSPLRANKAASRVHGWAFRRIL